MTGEAEHEFGEAEVVATTGKALLVKLDDGRQFWVPRSVVHEESEIEEDAEETDSGVLVVKQWWAEKEGYA